MSTRNATTETWYVVKYAMSKGILVYPAGVGVVHTSQSHHHYFTDGKRYSQPYTVGREAFNDREQAEEAAREMARRKIKSLQKQLRSAEERAKNPVYSGPTPEERGL